MSYPATVVNVMIAAPSDVKDEPTIIKEILDEWNQGDAERCGVVALPIGWQSHTSPEAGAHPQEIINRQVLAKADILVAVFWTRLGTETGAYASGTVEEIERSIQEERPVMLYFSNAPLPPDEIRTDQYSRLREFRTKMGKESLYRAFSNLEEFRSKFCNDIRQKLHEFEKGNDLSDHKSTKPVADSLSSEAWQLLRAAAQHDTTPIIRTRVNDGNIQIVLAGKAFTEPDNRRNQASWNDVLETLHKRELLERHGDSTFYITDAGYKMAEAFPVK